MYDRLYLALSFAGLGFIAACGGKVFLDAPGAGGAGGAGGTTSTGIFPTTSTSIGITTAVTNGPMVSSSSIVSTGVGGGDCGSAPDCQTCCIDSDPQGYETLLFLFITECACTGVAPCAMECANTPACKDPLSVMEEPCINCLNDASAENHPCVQNAVQSCFEDGSCAVVLECFQQC
jgi:hypothetical protein